MHMPPHALTLPLIKHSLHGGCTCRPPARPCCTAARAHAITPQVQQLQKRSQRMCPCPGSAGSRLPAVRAPCIRAITKYLAPILPSTLPRIDHLCHHTLLAHPTLPCKLSIACHFAGGEGRSLGRHGRKQRGWAAWRFKRAAQSGERPRPLPGPPWVMRVGHFTASAIALGCTHIVPCKRAKLADHRQQQPPAPSRATTRPIR